MLYVVMGNSLWGEQTQLRFIHRTLAARWAVNGEMHSGIDPHPPKTAGWIRRWACGYAGADKLCFP